MITRTEILIRDHQATGRLPEDPEARQQLLRTYQRQNKLSSLEVYIRHGRSSRAGAIADCCIEDIKALFEPWMGTEKSYDLGLMDRIEEAMYEYFLSISRRQKELGFCLYDMHPHTRSGSKPTWRRGPVSRCLWHGQLVAHLYDDEYDWQDFNIEVVMS